MFAYSIKFLGDEAVNLIRQQAEVEDFTVEDIQWVLTVPAIWSPRAKQFMREAAYEVLICFHGILFSKCQTHTLQYASEKKKAIAHQKLKNKIQYTCS